MGGRRGGGFVSAAPASAEPETQTEGAEIEVESMGRILSSFLGSAGLGSMHHLRGRRRRMKEVRRGEPGETLKGRRILVPLDASEGIEGEWNGRWRGGRSGSSNDSGVGEARGARSSTRTGRGVRRRSRGRATTGGSHSVGRVRATPVARSRGDGQSLRARLLALLVDGAAESDATSATRGSRRPHRRPRASAVRSSRQSAGRSSETRGRRGEGPLAVGAGGEGRGRGRGGGEVVGTRNEIEACCGRAGEYRAQVRAVEERNQQR